MPSCGAREVAAWLLGSDGRTAACARVCAAELRLEEESIAARSLFADDPAVVAILADLEILGRGALRRAQKLNAAIELLGGKR